MSEVGTYLLVDPEFPLQAFRGVAASMLLRPVGPGSGVRGSDYGERWSDGKVTVEWLEVGKLGCNFVWFLSPEPKRTAEYLVDKLDARPVSELVRRASAEDVDHDELVDLLYRVAYMSPEPTERVVALFEQRMADPRPTIRRAALNGYMLRRWSPLKDRVESITASDPDSEVRDTARRALELGT